MVVMVSIHVYMYSGLAGFLNRKTEHLGRFLEGGGRTRGRESGVRGQGSGVRGQGSGAAGSAGYRAAGLSLVEATVIFVECRGSLWRGGR
mgnify:CR=1 FL=1